MKYIFIDGSYFIFFRFHALKNWWGLARRDEGVLVPTENEEFQEKFRKTFAEKLKEIPKKLGIKKGEPYRVYVGQDCRQQKIWRMAHYDSYKDGRPDTSNEGYFFNIVYGENLFEQTLGDGCVLSYPALEADDVIAISSTHICGTNPDDECFIVSSDGDYLQLSSESRIHIYDLKFKNVKSRDPAYSQPDTSAKMFVMKRLCGDKSDNIPSAFPKCGKKTAMTIADLANGDDDALFAELMRRGGEKAVNQYKHNDMMMNFQCIPAHLREGFLATSAAKFK